MRRIKAALLLACVSLTVASVLSASSALAHDPFFEAGWDDSQPAEFLEMTDVILNCTLSGSKTAALDRWVVPEPARIARILLSPDETIVGIASFYGDPQQTASGEQFDPDGFTAAAQLAIRDKFGGIRFGRLYQPAYAVAEYNNKKMILKFNDVGPLRPGRKFDLSRAAMAYFDGIEKGLLPDFKVTPLPLGQVFTSGPVTDEQLAALGIENAPVMLAAAPAAVAVPAVAEPAIADPQITASLPAGPAVAPAEVAAHDNSGEVYLSAALLE